MLRSILVVAGAFAAGFFGYLLAAHFASKPAVPVVASQPSQPPPSTAQPLVQTPTHADTASEPSPPDHVPQGTFFLTERVTHTTDAGVMGVNAGTKVMVLERLANGNFPLSHFCVAGHTAPMQLSTHAPPVQCVPGMHETLAQSFGTQCLSVHLVPVGQPWQPQFAQTPRPARTRSSKSSSRGQHNRSRIESRVHHNKLRALRSVPPPCPPSHNRTPQQLPRPHRCERQGFPRRGEFCI